MSIALDEHVAARARVAAGEQGMSVSAWLSRAAARELLVQDGLRAVAEWEAEAGPLTATERAAADAVLDDLQARSAQRQ